MSDNSSFEATQAALREMEREQKERFAPAPDLPPRSEMEAYAQALAAARSRWVSFDGEGRLR